MVLWFLHMSVNVGKPLRILNRSNTNQAVQPLNIGRGMKFYIEEVEVLYYPSSESKGTEQLSSYREADLRLFFSRMQIDGFLTQGLNYENTSS